MIGMTVSHYRVLERLGGGGMGVVYKAEDSRLKRFVALKFLPPELTSHPASRERFTHEAQAAGSIDHPNICTIHEIDETPGGQVFICMAYVDGEPLRARLARGPLTVEEALSVAVQVAVGLGQAHRHGVVHRDIKPGNLMLTSDGLVKIVDFGLASLAGHARLTLSGQVVGTAAYMSPEQARGLVADCRSDLWSLGVVIYEMVSGRLPFGGGTDAATLHAVVYDELRPLAELRPDLPPQLLATVARCLAKDPAARYQTAAELIADLENVPRALGLATARTLWDLPTDQPGRRRRRLPARLRRALRPAIVLPAAVAVIVAALLAITPLGRKVVRDALHIPAVPGQQHLAVLPFANVGEDPANRAFCDGLTEILTSQLTQVESFQGSLWVVPQSELTARAIRAPSDARRVFGTNLAVTGSVQRGRNSVRLALNLIDTERSRQLRSRVIDEPLSNLNAVEDRVLVAVMDMLELELRPEARRKLAVGGTANSEAQDAYVHALGALQNSLGPSDPEVAITMLKRATALDPNFTLAQAALGEAYLALYRNTKDPAAVEEAVAACQKTARLDESLPQVQVLLGLISVATGKYEEAATAFQHALKLAPSNAQALVELGRAYAKLQKAPEAEAAFKKAIALQPDYWLGYSRLARFYWLQSRHREAEQEYRNALELTPENYLLLNDLGALYFDLSRWDEARLMFERSADARPNYIAYSNLGTLASQRANSREAATMFEKALAIDDHDYVLWGNLGTRYQHISGQETKGRQALSKAIELAKKSLSVDPRDPQVIVDLASYHAALGDKDQAQVYLKRLEADGKQQGDLARQIALVYADLGDRERTIEWIATALRLGCPFAEVEADPSLQELKKDPQFAALIKAQKQKGKK